MVPYFALGVLLMILGGANILLAEPFGKFNRKIGSRCNADVIRLVGWAVIAIGALVSCARLAWLWDLIPKIVSF